jgi:hypothetical protein
LTGRHQTLSIFLKVFIKFAAQKNNPGQLPLLVLIIRHALRKVFFIFAVFVFLFTSPGSYGQSRKVLNLQTYDNAQYHFGFTLGLNQMNFTVKPASDLTTRVYSSYQTPELNVDSSMLLAVNSTPTMGFNIGIVGDLRLSRYFNLRFVPDLAFGERYINYSILGYEQDGSTSLIDVRKNVGSVYIDFPLMIKYKSKRHNNMLAYLTAGGQYSLDIASNARKRDTGEQIVVKLNKNDFYALVGVGFDFYNPWFKLGVELKMAYGLFDMLKRDDTIYTLGIEKLDSKIFQLCFTFE